MRLQENKVSAVNLENKVEIYLNTGDVELFDIISFLPRFDET